MGELYGREKVEGRIEEEGNGEVKMELVGCRERKRGHRKTGNGKKGEGRNANHTAPSF